MLRRMSRSVMAVVLSVCVMFTMMPLIGGSVVHADTPGTYDISQGNIIIGDSGVTYGSPQATTDQYTGDTITIKQSVTGSTTNRIRVNRTTSVTIILSRVSINLESQKPKATGGDNGSTTIKADVDRHEGCALYISQVGDPGVNTSVRDLSGRTVTVKLAETNTLKSGPWDAGIEKNGTKTESGSLIIEDYDNTGETGSLTATSGKAGDSAGAGIGGGYYQYVENNQNYSGGFEGSNITINSGKITAQSYNTGAGIGGGQGGEGNNIAIKGGTVTASSYNKGDGQTMMTAGSGAGIGGGAGNAGNNITISGGTVTTTTLSGAGIGGGNNNSQTILQNTIKISGGTVTATSHGGGAGIGNGSDSFVSDTASFSTTTSGNAFVIASTTYGNSAISDSSGKTSTTDPWSGIIIENKAGKVYTGQKDGGIYSLTTSETLPDGYTLEVPSGKTFNVGEISDAPALTNSGLIINNGTMTGTTVSGLVLTKPAFSNTKALAVNKVATYNIIAPTPDQPSGFGYNTYAAETGGNFIQSNPVTSVSGTSLDLTFTTEPTLGDSFYISAVYGGNGYNAETDRTKVEIGQNAPPAPSTHDIKIEQPSGGNISVSKDNASAGDKVTVTADPDPGYHLDYIIVNGKKQTGTTFTMPDGNATVSAVFAINTYKITAKASPKKHGKVSGAKTVSYGSSVKLKAKAKSGYMFRKWTEKGKTVGKKKTLTVKNITAAHNYKAVFKKVPVKFTLSKYKSNMIRVHWAKVKGAKGYQISNNATGKMTVKWTGSNSLRTYTSIMKKKGVTYKYKMRYYKVKKGKRVWSSWTPIKTIKR